MCMAVSDNVERGRVEGEAAGRVVEKWPSKV